MSGRFIDCSPCIYACGDFTSCSAHYNNEAIKSTYTHRIMCVTDGACELVFVTDSRESKPKPFCKGDLLFLTPGEFYRILNRRGDFSVINIYFDFDKSRQHEDFPRYHRLMSGFDARLCSKSCEFTDTHAFERSRLITGISDAVSEARHILLSSHGGMLSRARSEALLFALLCKLANEPHKSKDSRKGRDIADFILANWDKPLDCTILSERFGYHPTHITRLIRQTTGKSPHEFIIQTKLDRACQLLIETGLSVTEIALLLGFSDSSHFAKAFRRHIGCAPTEYRAR